MGANSAWLFTLLISGVVTSRGNTQAYLNAHACTNAKKPHLVQMWIKLQKANGLDMCSFPKLTFENLSGHTAVREVYFVT